MMNTTLRRSIDPNNAVLLYNQKGPTGFRRKGEFGPTKKSSG